MQTCSTTRSHLDAGPVSRGPHGEHINLLEKDDIHNLSEQEPGIVLEGQVLVIIVKARPELDRDSQSHVERVIFSHLPDKLFLDPFPHRRPLSFIKPPTTLNLTNDPSPFALLGQNPA